MDNVFYLNKDLQIEKCKREAVAIAYFFKDKCVDSLYELGPKRFEKNVEITFFEPIGHATNLKASVKLQSNWQKENYPSYQSFLPSEDMCKLIVATTHRKFDNCWTRTYEDDGWPSYRYFPVLIKDGTSYLSDCSFVADNVYVSLVLTKEQFLEINPEVNLI